MPESASAIGITTHLSRQAFSDTSNQSYAGQKVDGNKNMIFRHGRRIFNELFLVWTEPIWLLSQDVSCTMSSLTKPNQLSSESSLHATFQQRI